MKRYNLNIGSKEFNWGKGNIIMVGFEKSQPDGKIGHNTFAHSTISKHDHLVDVYTNNGIMKIIPSENEDGYLARLTPNKIIDKPFSDLFVSRDDMDKIKIVKYGFIETPDKKVHMDHDYLCSIEDDTILKCQIKGDKHSDMVVIHFTRFNGVKMYLGHDAYKHIPQEKLKDMVSLRSCKRWCTGS